MAARDKSPIVDPFADEPNPAEPGTPAHDSPSIQAMTEGKTIDTSSVPPESLMTDGETSEQARIRELEEKIAQLQAQATKQPQAPTRPIPESQLTPDQRRIRQLEDQLARNAAKNYENSEDSFYDKADGEVLLLHFVEDGFTANGRVWYRGQELEFAVGSQAYEDTKDRNGRSWLEGLGNDSLQYKKYGKVYFRPGPWPGQQWTDPKSSEEEARRSRRAPTIPQVR